MATGKLKEYEKEIIIECRNQGKSYSYISERLNCSKDRVKNWCRKNGYGGFKSNEYNDPEKSLSVFLINLKEKTNDEYECVSGYVNSDSDVIIRCKKCGNEMVKNAQFVRKGKGSCDVCNKNESLIKKDKRKSDRELKKKRKELIKVIKKYKRIKERTIVKECMECGCSFSTTKSNRKYCSSECIKRYTTRRKELNRRSRLLSNGEIDYQVNLDKLIDRDESICQICGRSIDTNDFVITDEGYFVSGNDYPSIDHIHPVSEGGTHTWDNVQLAHRLCNSIKGNKVI